MIEAKAVGLLILSILLTLPSGGQQPANNGSGPHSQQRQKNVGDRPVSHLGDWLENHKDLPLDQQQKLLESNPAFKRLSADRQTQLLGTLRWFNGLTPQQKIKALRNMKYWESLTKEQKEQIRQAHQHMETLPTERRVMVRKELRNLRHMNPNARQQEFGSDQFKTTFSDQEQIILKNLAENFPPAQ